MALIEQKYYFPKLLETQDWNINDLWLVTRLVEYWSSNQSRIDIQLFLCSFSPDGVLKIFWSVTFKCSSTLYWSNIQPMDLKIMSGPAHLTIRQTIRTGSSPWVYKVMPMNSNAIELNPAQFQLDPNLIFGLARKTRWTYRRWWIINLWYFIIN